VVSPTFKETSTKESLAMRYVVGAVTRSRIVRETYASSISLWWSGLVMHYTHTHGNMSVLGSHAFMHHAEKNKVLHPVCHSYGHPVRRSSLGERCQKTQERERERERRWIFVSMTAMGVLRWFFDNIKCPGANYVVYVTFWMYL